MKSPEVDLAPASSEQSTSSPRVENIALLDKAYQDFVKIASWLAKHARPADECVHIRVDKPHDV